MRESRMMNIQRMAHKRIARVIRRMQRAVAEAKAAGRCPIIKIIR